MSVLDLLFGKPIASAEARAEKIGASAGIPIFGLDALSSAAYGPEAALTLLIPLGLAGVHYILPISLSIIVLLIIVYLSYRQTIDAYPDGGGSYTVAHENLGTFPGLLAAAALMIDYILVVAVGISAGVGALISAVPQLHPYTLSLCLGILVIITIVNLRGVKEAGGIFMIPTYLFIVTLLIAIAIGAYRTLASGGHPLPVEALPSSPAPVVATAGVWLLLKAFASGCTAMTGVEAVSNGVQAFREPCTQAAQRTLTVIIALLVVMLAGIAWLVSAYGISATDPGSAAYQSVLSLLLTAVAGKGIFYYVTILSVLLVLVLSANTAFADFPRLCRIIAHDNFLPHSFTARGRRLVFSEGIYVLAFLAAILLILFGGVTDRLIPLFAVGAFLAFTLSQTGMVFHWIRKGGSWHNILVNGLGALATAVTVLVVLVAKFTQGAWVTLLLIPLLLALMLAVRRHYASVDREMASDSPIEFTQLTPPIVVVPIENWNRTSKRALEFALTVCTDIIGLHIQCDEENDALPGQWREFVEQPAQKLGVRAPRLVRVPSPYRLIINPIVDFVLDLEVKNPGSLITVVIPELVERHWYFYFLHNMRAAMLKGMLYVKGNHRVIVVNVPWYLDQ
jgi:amino acid transporter